MIGRNLTDVEKWTTIPPHSTLTYAWGPGGCQIEFEGGNLEMSEGDWMWLDAGFAHVGRNNPGSNFFTVFFSDSAVVEAGLDIERKGAGQQKAPQDLANLFVCFVNSFIQSEQLLKAEDPIVRILLDWVKTTFEPLAKNPFKDEAIVTARELMLRDPVEILTIGEIAKKIEVSASEFTRRFTQKFRISPMAYRKQQRLYYATRLLCEGRSITEAAHSAGFSDGSHLTRTFKDQYGVTPSHWVSCLNIK